MLCGHESIDWTLCDECDIETTNDGAGHWIGQCSACGAEVD